MGQVFVTALRAITQPEPQNGIANGETPAAKRARTHALVAAVNVLNQSGLAGPSREIAYSTDSATKQLVIQVIDKQSGTVVVQWPSEYALQMAQEYQKEQHTNEPLL
jgi:uncharacterized FlaG/YvyC family protein